MIFSANACLKYSTKPNLSHSEGKQYLKITRVNHSGQKKLDTVSTTSLNWDDLTWDCFCSLSQNSSNRKELQGGGGKSSVSRLHEI